jgi:hypothetical protein
MAAKETTLKEIGKMLAHVVEHMATKDNLANVTTKDDLVAVKVELKSDFAALSLQVASIERELKTIRYDLDDLRSKFENVIGYRKEIDHALERITAIERHLGIKRKAAA